MKRVYQVAQALFMALWAITAVLGLFYAMSWEDPEPLKIVVLASMYCATGGVGVYMLMWLDEKIDS